MNRITFKASGRRHEFFGDKELRWWEKILMDRGLSYERDMDGKDVYIIVDDIADPVFKPKENPLHMASE